MTNIDTVIISLIIVISAQLLYDYFVKSNIFNISENFAEIDLDNPDRDALLLYKEWLKKNEGILVDDIHKSNFKTLNNRPPRVKEEHTVVRRDPVPKRSDLDGSINFLEEQNKILSKNFEKYANQIGFISSNEELMDFYVNTSAVDREIVVIDPNTVISKKKLPLPKKLNIK